MRPPSPASQSFPPPSAQPGGRQSYQRSAYPGDPNAVPHSAPHAYLTTGRPAPLLRVLALLCYSIPLVPSLWLLWRERHSRFLRFHAAQAVVVCVSIAGGQIAIWLLLLFAGSVVHNTLLASAIAVVVVALFAALGLVALLLWFRLAGDCLDGRARRLPFAGKWADRLEHLTARRARRP